MYLWKNLWWTGIRACAMKICSVHTNALTLSATAPYNGKLSYVLFKLPIFNFYDLKITVSRLEPTKLMPLISAPAPYLFGHWPLLTLSRQSDVLYHMFPYIFESNLWRPGIRTCVMKISTSQQTTQPSRPPPQLKSTESKDNHNCAFVRFMP